MKLKVAIYSGTIPSTTFIERLIVGLASDGIEVYLFGKIMKQTQYKQPLIFRVGNQHGLLGFLQAIARILVLLLKYADRFSTMKNHLGFGPLSGKIEFITWQKYAPVLLHLPDVFHVQWAKSAGDWVFLKELFGVKLVLSLRGTHINNSPLADANLPKMYRSAFPVYDGFHGVSHSILNEAIPYGIIKESSQVIYSGLKINESALLDRQPNSPLRLLVVGRFHWIKGYHYLLDAMVLLKEKNFSFKLTVVAQGDMPEELLYQMHEMKLVHVTNWINSIPFEKVLEQMQNHDLLILPSVNEGIANVALEAMNVGLPVLTTNCGGMKEVIEDGVNGIMVEVRDPVAIANGVIRFQCLSELEKSKMIECAHHTIRKHFDIQKNIQQFSKLYSEIICERGH